MKWTLPELHRHLQGAVDLELWTIPYYLTALYSIKKPSSEAYRLIQSVVYEEMLHVQLACNIANAYGCRPKFTPPVYGGTHVPHVNFDLDDPNPTTRFHPYSTALGALDRTRLNTMCLIEYPAWDTSREPDLRPRNDEYGSIGEFYDALTVGLRELRGDCRGQVNQIDEFKGFFGEAGALSISRDGTEGYQEALKLIQIVVDQGEGQTEGVSDIAPEFRNTADGYQESWPHFQKFSWIRDQDTLPETYSGVEDPPPGSPGHVAQQQLISDFSDFLDILNRLFGGEPVGAFGATMAKLGGDVLTCWKAGAVPRFSRPADRGGDER